MRRMSPDAAARLSQDSYVAAKKEKPPEATPIKRPYVGEIDLDQPEKTGETIFTAHELSEPALVALLKKGQLQSIKERLAEIYLQEQGISVLNRAETTRALVGKIPDQMIITMAQQREKYIDVSGKALDQNLGELLASFKNEVFALWTRPATPVAKPFKHKTEPRNPFNRESKS